MIKKKTVFILGAGASYDYFYPLAFDLSRDICRFRTDNGLEGLATLSDATVDEVTKLISLFRRTGNHTSIDRFLEIHLSAHPEWDEIGRRIIANVLLKYELDDFSRYSKYYPDNPRRKVGIQGLGGEERDDWYSYFWSQINEGARTLDELSTNPITIITFNYDRSFEFRIAQMIAGAFDLDLKEAWGHFSKIFTVCHIHGQLGPLCLNPDIPDLVFGIPYGGVLKGEREIRPTTIKHAAKSISIYSQAEESPQVEQAKKLIQSAEVVLFLGFGFHRVNIERLGILDLTQTKATPIPRMYSSSYGLSNAKQDRINTWLRRGSDMGKNARKVSFDQRINIGIQEYLDQHAYFQSHVLE